MTRLLAYFIWVAFATSAGLLLFAIWARSPLPLMDLVEWAWQGQVGAQVLAGAPEAQGVAFKTWPVPNALVPALLTSFALIADPFMGARLLASLYVIGIIAFSLAAAQTEEGGPTPAVAMLVFALLTGTAFLNGYLNFAFGTLFLATAGLALMRGWTPGPSAIAALAVFMFFTHAVTLAAFSILIAAFVLSDRLRLRHLLALIPAYLLFIWYVWAEHVGAQTETRGSAFDLREAARFLAYKAYTVMKLGPYHNFAVGGTTDFDRAPLLFWAGVGVNAIWMLGLIAVLVVLLFRLRDQALRPLILAVVTLVLLFLVLPEQVSKVVNPGERLLISAAALALAVGAAALPARLLTTLGILSMVFPVSLVSLLLVTTNEPKRTTIYEEPLPQSSAVLFAHYPGRHAYRLTAGERPLSIRFQTGILQTTDP